MQLFVDLKYWRRSHLQDSWFCNQENLWQPIFGSAAGMMMVGWRGVGCWAAPFICLSVFFCLNSSVNDRWLHGFSVVQNWLRVLRVGLAFYISGCAGHWRGPARRCCRDHCRGSAPGLCAVASGAARRGAVFVNIFTIQIHYTHFKYPPTSAMI